MAVISKGITLSYQDGDLGTTKQLTNLMEIPELGGDTEAIEITTLADAAHKYTDGIMNYGDSITFKFLYEAEQFEQLCGLGVLGHSSYIWTVSLPDGITCSFQGKSSVKLDGVGVNAALTYTLNIKPTSEMTWGFGE